MATIWLTYAWDDNREHDVDFIAQELEHAGVSVKLDRWNLGSGKLLWEQIATFIQDTSQSDGWILYATQNSLGSEACKEEFAYALDRALHTRGVDYPIIGLFPSTIDTSIVPVGVRVRLCVCTNDQDWKERIKSAAEGRAPRIEKLHIDPFHIQIHQSFNVDTDKFIEIRPRAGTWSPFFVAIPLSEKDGCRPHIMFGPAGRVPSGSVLYSSGDGPSDDGAWWIMFAQNEATPTQSYFIGISLLPSSLFFGVHNGSPQYRYEFVR
jgi:hypothetical protein